MADETDGNSQASEAATELQLNISSKRVSKASKTFAALTEIVDSDGELEAAPESQARPPCRGPGDSRGS